MIERFYLKDYLSFDEAELELQNGLVVFSGPSGSGKSILMEAVLASVGGATCNAAVCESSVSWEIDEDSCGIANEDINVFKHIKKEKSRYFINNQSLSKKAMYAIASNHLRHLSLKDYSDFENENLLEILDGMAGREIQNIKQEYRKSFQEFKEVQKELQQVLDEEKRIVELKEFAKFEIDKIASIDPKEGEDEELMQIKKELSRKEKVLEMIAEANGVFNFEYQVSQVLDMLDVDSAFFDDAMNELRATLEGAKQRFSALDDMDVESVLDRIEQLSELKRRYGSIEEALLYKEQKVGELKKYENIEIEKEGLQKHYDALHVTVQELSSQLSSLRKQTLPQFIKELNNYLQQLYMRDAKVAIVAQALGISGKDRVVLELDATELGKLSTGEFNRLRLAVLAIKSAQMSKHGGVLMLDEIDANLSGEESMSVARVLKKLTKNFQIFVISHQPQLTSMGDQHFLVYKDGNISKTKELNFDERIEEIARIISGDKISDEARKFAKELLSA
ncbi:MAG: ATPase [Epsilonproteobacteria bacterium]|nr:ATPase [Campylobacterota bacterium]